MGGKGTENIKKNEKRLLDEVKQQLWSEKIIKVLKSNFFCADMPEIEEKLLKMKKEAFEEQKKFKDEKIAKGEKLEKGQPRGYNYVDSDSFASEEDWNKWNAGKREKTPLGYFMRDREEKLTKSIDSLLAICSMVKLGNTQGINLKALADNRLMMNTSLTVNEKGQFEYIGDRYIHCKKVSSDHPYDDLYEEELVQSPGSNNRLKWSSTDRDHYVLDQKKKHENRKPLSVVKPGNNEKLIFKIFDEVASTIKDMSREVTLNGQNVNHTSKVASTLWEDDIQQHLQDIKENNNYELELMDEDLHFYKPLLVDEEHYPIQSVLPQVVAARINQTVWDIYKGKIYLPDLDPTKMSPAEMAQKLAEDNNSYMFLTERERAHQIFGGADKFAWVDPGSNRMHESQLNEATKFAKMTLADIENDAVVNEKRKETRYLVKFDPRRNASRFGINVRDVIAKKIEKNGYDNYKLAEDYDQIIKSLKEEKEHEFKGVDSLYKIVDRDNGKEELAQVRAENAKMTKNFDNLHDAVRAVWKNYNKSQMLDTLMDCLADAPPNTNPKTIMDNISKMTNEAKLNGFWKLLFWRKNQYADKLSTMLESFAGKKEELSKDKMDELRITVESLKYSIDKGKQLDDAGIAKLNRQDQARYKLANKVIESFNISIGEQLKEQKANNPEVMENDSEVMENPSQGDLSF